MAHFNSTDAAPGRLLTRPAARRVGWRYFRWTTSALLGLGLLPFFALAFSNFPFWDDFGMAMMVREHGLWGAQQVFYNTWGGRYGTAFLQTVGNPLTYGWLGGFRFTPLVSLGGTLLALYLGLRELSQQRLAPVQAGQAAALLLLLALAGMPTIYPMFYWFTTATGYESGIILMLLAMLGGLRALRATTTAVRLGWYGLAHISVILTVGLTEIALLLLGWTLLVALVCSWRGGRRRAAAAWGGLLISAAVGGAVAVLAPGNLVRMYGAGHTTQTHAPLNVLGAVRYATDYYTTFLSKPSQVLVLLLLAALLGPVLVHTRRWRPAGFRLPLAAGIGVLLVGGGLSFLFFALVNKNPPPGRTQSFIWLWMLLSWTGVLWAAVPTQISGGLRRAVGQMQRVAAVLTFFLLAVGLERTAWTEWLRNAPTWRTQNEARFARMAAAARAGRPTVVLAPFGGISPRRIAIMGENLFYNPHPTNSVQRSNNDPTAHWFGLDSVRLAAPPAPPNAMGPGL
ncbi:DUF6056 family protein [Hymenobacter sp. UYCo722]|uniref:DUF6056 family protein n=1 Tax=Hymenobacter sp. UYCo722 TaxID=3156335 RepID=UPI003398DF6E